MPEKRTLANAKKDKKEGKAASTQAGEFVHEEMEHVARGKHGVKNRKQAIAIGLSKARRAGVDLKPPKKGTASEATRKKASQDRKKGQAAHKSKSTSKSTTKTSGKTRKTSSTHKASTSSRTKTGSTASKTNARKTGARKAAKAKTGSTARKTAGSTRKRARA